MVVKRKGKREMGYKDGCTKTCGSIVGVTGSQKGYFFFFELESVLEELDCVLLELDVLLGWDLGVEDLESD